MTTLAYPNAELVGAAWLTRTVGLVGAMVAGTLPKPEKWTDGAFVTVRALPAGSPNPTLAEMRYSILQLDFWAATGTTVRPLWAKALQLGEQVRVATFRDGQAYGKPINMPISGYQPARVLAAYLATEPTRVENDPSAYARVTCDLAVDWTV